MSRKNRDSFRVGRVTVYRRGSVWYLRYHEQGRRHQVRGGPGRTAVAQLAAQVNAQLELGMPAATSFESISIGDLRRRWLEHHEHVLHSSVATLHRYRTATDHLVRFAEKAGRQASRVASFGPAHAEAFVRHLRQLRVASNDHRNTVKRPLRGKGIKYVFEVCRTLFNFAVKRRYLPPYAQNPFSLIEIDRIPAEPGRPHADVADAQERALLEACDEWQWPIFLTLILTGMRPGELTHLLLPDDLDLDQRWVHVRNKPELGWRIKTRSERQIPLMPELAAVLEHVVAGRRTGPVFLRRRFGGGGVSPPLTGCDRHQLGAELERRLEARRQELGRPAGRPEQAMSFLTEA